MKLNINFLKKEANVEADVERLVEKKMDIDSKRPVRKTRYQIRQEEKRKNKEQQFRQSMIGVAILFALGIFLIGAMIIVHMVGIE